MIRASSVHRIATHKPFFNIKEFFEIQDKFKEKIEAKGFNFRYFDIEELKKTSGLKTIAVDYEKQLIKKRNFDIDPLPDGAKNYLEELWLEKHYNFCDISQGKDDDFALRKGTLVEDDAIRLLGEASGMVYNKYEGRITDTRLFLTGEADIVTTNTIRDIKCPLNWKTFRKKEGIETAYYWQLIAYCLLYEKSEAYLDYILMPTPVEILNDMMKYMSEENKEKLRKYEEAVNILHSFDRIKTYEIPKKDIYKDVKFLEKRLKKAKYYYQSLTYEKCMKL